MISMQTHRNQSYSPSPLSAPDAPPAVEHPPSFPSYRERTMPRFNPADFLLRRPQRDERPEWCATIVVRSPVTKIDALAIVALAVDSPVRDARTMRPYIELEGGARAEIEIPKFGEPPPLAIDVYSTTSHEHAALEALRLMAALEQYTGWSIRPDFEV